jgi:hypothetical protein
MSMITEKVGTCGWGGLVRCQDFEGESLGEKLDSGFVLTSRPGALKGRPYRGGASHRDRLCGRERNLT